MENELKFWVASKPHTAMFPFTAVKGFKEKCLAACGKQAKQKGDRGKSPAMQMNFSYIKCFLYKRLREEKMPVISCDSLQVLHKSCPSQDLTWSLVNYWSQFYHIIALEGTRLRSIQIMSLYFFPHSFDKIISLPWKLPLPAWLHFSFKQTENLPDFIPCVTLFRTWWFPEASKIKDKNSHKETIAIKKKGIQNQRYHLVCIY